MYFYIILLFLLISLPPNTNHGTCMTFWPITSDKYSNTALYHSKFKVKVHCLGKIAIKKAISIFPIPIGHCAILYKKFTQPPILSLLLIQSLHASHTLPAPILAKTGQNCQYKNSETWTNSKYHIIISYQIMLTFKLIPLKK